MNPEKHVCFFHPNHTFCQQLLHQPVGGSNERLALKVDGKERPSAEKKKNKVKKKKKEKSCGCDLPKQHGAFLRKHDLFKAHYMREQHHKVLHFSNSLLKVGISRHQNRKIKK